MIVFITCIYNIYSDVYEYEFVSNVHNPCTCGYMHIQVFSQHRDTCIYVY